MFWNTVDNNIKNKVKRSQTFKKWFIYFADCYRYDIRRCTKRVYFEQLSYLYFDFHMWLALFFLIILSRITSVHYIYCFSLEEYYFYYILVLLSFFHINFLDQISCWRRKNIGSSFFSLCLQIIIIMYVLWLVLHMEIQKEYIQNKCI